MAFNLLFVTCRAGPGRTEGSIGMAISIGITIVAVMTMAALQWECSWCEGGLREDAAPSRRYTVPQRGETGGMMRTVSGRAHPWTGNAESVEGVASSPRVRRRRAAVSGPIGGITCRGQ